MLEAENENAAVLVGYRRGSIWYARMRQSVSGTPSEVAFDWAWVLAREERYADVIGFYHTHPAGLATPSERDERTMQAWHMCFGKDLLCVIQSGALLNAYLFEGEQSRGRPLASVERFPRKVIVAFDAGEPDATQGEMPHAR